MIKSIDSGARLPRFMSQFYHLLMVWPWDNCGTFLDFSFFICKREVMKVHFPRKLTLRWR